MHQKIGRAKESWQYPWIIKLHDEHKKRSLQVIRTTVQNLPPIQINTRSFSLSENNFSRNQITLFWLQQSVPLVIFCVNILTDDCKKWKISHTTTARLSPFYFHDECNFSLSARAELKIANCRLCCRFEFGRWAGIHAIPVKSRGKQEEIGRWSPGGGGCFGKFSAPIHFAFRIWEIFSSQARWISLNYRFKAKIEISRK